MKTIIAICSFIALGISANAQTINTGNILVIVKNESQNALQNATVELIKSKDSSLVKAGITDNKGITEFEHIAFGSYLRTSYDINCGHQ